ncbi:hypothetical protein M9H77_06980 [Catharanthus roseus]|uniref:Uncharacterized protein n=1 Tax=Catharanthus roseus TaxID=4058 RepID=A0ACC0BTN8_CATRO|nr:hypothetical protein M9H77_06980 [Catharanthus roseus]
MKNGGEFHEEGKLQYPYRKATTPAEGVFCEIGNLVSHQQRNKQQRIITARMGKCYCRSDRGSKQQLRRGQWYNDACCKNSGIEQCFHIGAMACLKSSEETGLSGSKPAVALIKKNNQLAKVTGSFLSLLDRYRRLVRHLIYLTITRPEMAYVVHNLPQFITNPNKTTGMLHYELHFSYFLENQEITHYFSSSTEAEYRFMAVAHYEVKWPRQLLRDLHIPLSLLHWSESTSEVVTNFPERREGREEKKEEKLRCRKLSDCCSSIGSRHREVVREGLKSFEEMEGNERRGRVSYKI